MPGAFPWPMQSSGMDCRSAFRSDPAHRAPGPGPFRDHLGLNGIPLEGYRARRLLECLVTDVTRVRGHARHGRPSGAHRHPGHGPVGRTCSHRDPPPTDASVSPPRRAEGGTTWPPSHRTYPVPSPGTPAPTDRGRWCAQYLTLDCGRVRGYRGYRMDLGHGRRRLELPDACVSLVFNLGAPVWVTLGTLQDAPARARTPCWSRASRRGPRSVNTRAGSRAWRCSSHRGQPLCSPPTR